MRLDGASPVAGCGLPAASSSSRSSASTASTTRRAGRLPVHGLGRSPRDRLRELPQGAPRREPVCRCRRPQGGNAHLRGRYGGRPRHPARSLAQPHRTENDWRSSMDAYALPTMGGVAVDAIQTPDVLAVSNPSGTPSGRPCGTSSSAYLRSWTGPSPAATARTAQERQDHQAPRSSALRASANRARRGAGRRRCSLRCPPRLQFMVLTAARSGEARKATWAEIDLEKRLGRFLPSI